MARIRFAAIGDEQIARIIAGAQDNAKRAGETFTGPTYSAGVSHKPPSAADQMSRSGLLEGEFGATLNDKNNPLAPRAREEAKRFIDQAGNSPWFQEYFGAMGSAPAAPADQKEMAR